MVSGPRPADQVRRVLAGGLGVSAGLSREDTSGSAARRRLGTEHLLLGLTHPGATGPAGTGDVLAAADLTFPVLISVVRSRAGRPDGWQSDDGVGHAGAGHDGVSDDGANDDRDGPRSLGEFDRYPPRRPIRYTPAARAVLHRATGLAAAQGQAEVDRDHLLRGLLAVDDHRAAELVRACGVDPAHLRGQLAGAEEVTTVGDRIAPELRPTRDALVGRASYRSGGIRGRLVAVVLRVVPIADAPVIWVQLEAREQARRLGQSRVGTEHLVLAILATHETLRCYPHLRPDEASAGRYAGGEVLAEAGITYHDAVGTVREQPDRLGTDARTAASYTSRRARPRYGGTGQVLLAVLTQDDSRGANLLRRLGHPPARLRAHVRATLSAARTAQPLEL